MDNKIKERIIKPKKVISDEMTEEQKYCPFCNGGRAGHLKQFLPMDKYDYGAKVDGNELCFCLCERDGHRVLCRSKINYCPMCRRKLEE